MEFVLIKLVIMLIKFNNIFIIKIVYILIRLIVWRGVYFGNKW